MSRIKVATLLIAVGLAALAFIAIFKLAEEKAKPNLVLSNYPKLFEKDVIIIVGENATEMEYDCARQVAQKLREITGNEPTVRNITTILKEDKVDNNLILVGTPRSNTMFKEVYEITNATRITKEYLGENKGVLEILESPWNSGKALLIISGYNELGVKAAAVKLLRTNKLNGTRIVVLCVPVLKWPFDGAVTTDHVIAFGWYNIEGVQKYLLQVDNNSDFSSPEIETYVGEAQFKPSDPLADGIYHWRVKAVYESGEESMWSDPFEFTIFHYP